MGMQRRSNDSNCWTAPKLETMSQGEAVSRRARSHELIVRAAAKLLREQGLDGAPVDAVMAAAGLTRGGFYAHFADKTEMIVEAIDLAFAQAKKNLFGAEGVEGDAWLARANARYLSEAHVADVAHGCALPALGGQIPRSPPRVRDSFARNVEEIIDFVATRMGGGHATDADRKEATRILALWVGTMTLARSFDGKRAAEILEVGRIAVSDRAPAKRARKAQRETQRETQPAESEAQATGDASASKASRPKSSRAVPAKTRPSASSPKPAAAKAWTSRSQA